MRHAKLAALPLTLLSLVLLLGSGGTAQAADLDNAWEVGILTPYGIFDDIETLGNFAPESEFGWGIRGGYNFTEKHEIELTHAEVATEVFSSGTQETRFHDVQWTSLGYIFNFHPNEKHVPFVTAGLGTWSSQNGHGPDDDGQLVMVGGGYRWFVKDNLNLRVDFQLLNTTGGREVGGNDPDGTQAFIGLGVGWIFGGD